MTRAFRRSRSSRSASARASGGTLDARVAHPFVEPGEQFRVAHESAGDVMARFLIRVEEARISLDVVGELAHGVTVLEVVAASGPKEPVGSGLGIVEGWRGSIVHRVELDGNGALSRCKIVDPSFLNWPALSVALADTIVPDFPLANKSFNLSYAGNDL